MEFFPPKMADAREESAPLKKGNPVGTYHRTGYLPISYCKKTTALERTKYSVEASLVSWRNKCCLFPFLSLAPLHSTCCLPPLSFLFYHPCPSPFILLYTPYNPQ